MKKTRKAKLTMSRETLYDLERRHLDRVAAGSDISLCPSDLPGLCDPSIGACVSVARPCPETANC